MNNDPILVEKSNTEIATKKNLASLPEAGSAVRSYSQSRQQQRHRSRSRSNPREKKENNNSDPNDSISGTDLEIRSRPRGKSTEGVEMIDRSQIMCEGPDSSSGDTNKYVETRSDQQENNQSKNCSQKQGLHKKRVLMSPGVRPVRVTPDSALAVSTNSRQLFPTAREELHPKVAEKIIPAMSPLHSTTTRDRDTEREHQDIPRTPNYPSNIHGFLEGLADGLRNVCINSVPHRPRSLNLL